MWSLSSDEQKQQLGNNITAEVNANNNKKKKEFEECNCASVQINAANSGLFCDKCENQEQKFRGNSKADKLKLGFGKEEEEEAIDSGFISGFNTSSSLAFEEEKVEEDIGHIEKPNINVSEQKQQKNQSKETQESITNLDSGCIEPEEEEEEEFDVDVAKSANVARGVAKTDVITKRQTGAQVQNELHNIKVDAAARQSSLTNDKMRVKNNVDNGISERFCLVSLETGGSGINNLNSTQRRSNTQSSPALQQQTRQKARITAGWEEFYQQNSDGDT